VRITVGIGQTPTTGHPGHHLWFGLDQVSRFLGGSWDAGTSPPPLAALWAAPLVRFGPALGQL